MCGLVGVFRTKYGTDTFLHKKLFTDMLYTDYVRGEDSTGVAVVHTNELRASDKGEHDSFIYKRALGAFDFMCLPEYNKAMSFSRPVAILGHNRKATKGSVVDANAHPFKVGDIILTHNGTLTNKHTLPDHQYFDTDSECIAHLINDRGIEETAKLLLGAWALVWWNTKEKTLNFYCNGERPFHYCFLEKGDTLVYSSSELLPLWAAEHNKTKIDGESSTSYGLVISTDKDTLYTFKEGSTVPETRLITPKKPYAPISYYSKPKTYQSTYKGDKKQEHQRKKKLLELLLHSMRGESLPFEVTAAHSYTNKEKAKIPDGVFLAGRILTDYVYRVFPEMKDMVVSCQVCTRMALSDVGKHNKGTWLGTLMNFSMDLDKGTVTLLLEDPSPFPQYNLGDDLRLLEEEHQEKKYLYVQGPEGIQIPCTEYKVMVAEGCCHCGEDLTEEDAGSIVWLQGDYPLCSSCSNEEDMATLNLRNLI